ncbi:MAG: hypothetical protein IJQ90_02910 [Alphaproteobacteria bacterium]|nr:hypothetical protein [Alphaproteobacteria bacterium]
MKTSYKFLIWFVYLCLLDIPFVLTKYFLDNDMLNKWYFFLTGIMFMFMGWMGYALASKLSNTKKRK